MKQSMAAIVDLTNDQHVSLVIRIHICHFKEVKQTNAATVDYVKMGGWHHCNMVASISTNKFHWLELIYLVAMILKHHLNMSRLMAHTIAIWLHLS
jgi:UDP-2,3-diacylglucosamine pyrophosphatase LpxH